MARHVLASDRMLRSNAVALPAKRSVPRKRGLWLESLWRLAAAIAVALVVAGWPRIAAATITIESQVTRTVNDHPNVQPFDISYSDCTKMDQITFNVTHTATTGQTLEVWMAEGATPNCADPTARSGTTQTCAQLFSTPASATPNSTITLNVVDIVGKLTNVKGCDDSSSNTDPRPIVIWFMLLSSATDSAMDTAQWNQTHVDLLGPAPPTEIQTSFGDTRIVFSFTDAIADDLDHYNVYCVESGGVPTTTASTSTTSASSTASSSSATGTGGGGGTGGTGTGGTSTTGTAAGGAGGTTTSGSGGAAGSTTNTGSCTAADLIVNQKPTDKEAAYLAGTLAIGGSGYAVGLTNETRYACAIASVDKLGNIGALSGLVCETPHPVDDFWKLYRQAGGQAGGGYCGIGGSRAGAVLGVWVAAALGALALRRGRRERRRDRGQR